MADRPKRPRSPTFGKLDRRLLLEEQSRRGASLGIIAGLISIALIAFARAFVFQTFKIPSGSMMPTLEIGDHIIVNKAIYGMSLPGSTAKHWRVRLPQRGDVVVFYRFSEFEDRDSNTHYIKRIVAVPGDRIEVKEYRTYINEKPIGRPTDQYVGPENQLENDVGRNYGPVTLENDEYFVLGDNQPNSRDSRFYGPIHLSDIEGLAEMIYWSWFTYAGSSSVRWERVGMSIR